LELTLKVLDEWVRDFVLAETLVWFFCTEILTLAVPSDVWTVLLTVPSPLTVKVWPSTETEAEFWLIEADELLSVALSELVWLSFNWLWTFRAPSVDNWSADTAAEPLTWLGKSLDPRLDSHNKVTNNITTPITKIRVIVGAALKAELLLLEIRLYLNWPSPIVDTLNFPIPQYYYLRSMCVCEI
jgi:hypothetical protein